MDSNTVLKNHKVSIEAREKTTITGVKDVVEFDLNQVILETSMGMLSFKGNDLKVTRLSLEKGEVDVRGNVDSLEYTKISDYSEKGKSFIKRMFK